jgi:hypothetical protein
MTPEVDAMLAFMSHTTEERLEWLIVAGLDDRELRVLTLLGCVDGRPALTERRAASRLGLTPYRLRKIKQTALTKVRVGWRAETNRPLRTGAKQGDGGGDPWRHGPMTDLDPAAGSLAQNSGETVGA